MTARRPAAQGTARRAVALPRGKADRAARAVRVLDTIVARFPDAKIELDYRDEDPWQLLVAVVLSAQCTDAAVNKATPALFAAFPDVRAFAAATAEQVEPYVKSLGLFRNKAKNIVAAAGIVVERYDGALPRERALLEELPGVGKKSAAVIVANAFGEPALAVDTHVGRVARRLGLTRHEDPDKVEVELTALLPRARLLEAHHALIWHGRRICHARVPECSSCPVLHDCPRIGVTSSK